MSKDDVMSAPKGRSAILGALKSEVAAVTTAPPADNVRPIAPPEAQAPAPAAEESRAHGTKLDLSALRAMRPKKEAPVQQPVRIPPALKEDLNLICFATGQTKNDFIAEALRVAVAREKKRLGMD
jgi:hypothetical protein